jgi:lysozyme family protein
MEKPKPVSARGRLREFFGNAPPSHVAVALAVGLAVGASGLYLINRYGSPFDYVYMGVAVACVLVGRWAR